MEKSALRTSVGGITSLPACSIIGRNNTAGASFVNEPTEEGALRDRVEKLERLVGKLTLENEVLKRGLQHSLGRFPGSGRSSGYGYVSVSPSGGSDR